jgi:beta-lactamase class A
VKQKLILISFGLIVFFLIIFLLIYIYQQPCQQISCSLDHPQDSQWQFLNPYAKEDNISLKKIEEFKSTIDKSLQNSDIQTAIYFRDLNNGPWFSINGNLRFDGGSLLKIPVLIAYYKNAENNPELLNKKIKYQEKKLLFSDPDFEKSLVLGKTYTVQELLEAMIINSDNTSLALLTEYYEKEKIKPTLAQTELYLGIFSEIETINIVEYSGMLRILYNSEYLSAGRSNQALDLMTKTNFTDGLTKYLPDDLLVAHKYGVRTYPKTNEKQLHDCGIIYKNSSPYILCIMTKGKDLKKQAEVIASISQKVYKTLVD